MSSKKLTKSQKKFQRDRKRRIEREELEIVELAIEKNNRKFSNKIFLATCATMGILIGTYTTLSYTLNTFHTEEKEKKKNSIVQETSILEKENNKLTLEELVKMPGVKEVKHFDTNPDVILISQIHPAYNFDIIETEKKVIGNATYIANSLHDNYGINSILYEGITEKFGSDYKKGKNFKLDVADFMIEHFQTIINSLQSRKWNLHAFETEENRDVAYTHLGNVYRIQDEYKRKCEEECKKGLTSKQLKENIDNCKIFYSEKLDNYLTEEVQKEMWHEMYEKRENKVIEECMNAKKPIIVVFGIGHNTNLGEKLKENNLKYVSIIPEGLEYETSPEYHENIVRNMFRLQVPTINTKFYKK